MQHLLLGVLLLVCCLPVASCSDLPRCHPSFADGTWNVIGSTPPDVNRIAVELRGMRLHEANKFLGAEPFSEGSAENMFNKAWVFESRRISSEDDCKHPARMKISQRFLVVRAELSSGVIKNCSLQQRDRVGDVAAPLIDAVNASKWPLDDKRRACSSLDALGH
jgi:hypothetical protein